MRSIKPKLTRGNTFAGNLRCGCALLLLGVASAIAAAQTFTTLASFDGTDGKYPDAALVQGADGNLYGTTSVGGSGGKCAGGQGCGIVFKITPVGTLTVLYNFCIQTNCTDGLQPEAPLVLAKSGNFYGTTVSGGTGAGCPANQGGCGTVFKITPSGSLTTLYNFCAETNCADGSFPVSPLVQGTDGNFYGVTTSGGIASCFNFGCGTVFKITPSGVFTTLYSFCPQANCADGFHPVGALVQASDGNFYGATQSGGITGGGCTVSGCGTIFKISASGAFTLLHSFTFNGPESPSAGLVQGTDGKLYGTSFFGGVNDRGAVFTITLSGTAKEIYAFCKVTGCPDGSNPATGLVQGNDGNFYGTTEFGGPGASTIFKITPSGTLTTLYNFCTQTNCTDGYNPNGLVQHTNGTFYGTAAGGGTVGGTVFSLSTGLGPFVETLPNSGKVGASIKILGTNLKGATSVTFNGTAATFTVLSNSGIKTTVPTGATTGTVTVVTPGRTLNSNAVFTVTQ